MLFGWLKTATFSIRSDSPPPAFPLGCGQRFGRSWRVSAVRRPVRMMLFSLAAVPLAALRSIVTNIRTLGMFLYLVATTVLQCIYSTVSILTLPLLYTVQYYQYQFSCCTVRFSSVFL